MSTTPIIQFGTSRFLQAHADLFISEAMARGKALGPVTAINRAGRAWFAGARPVRGCAGRAHE